MKRVLFVCSQNRLRSLTAEQIFSGLPGLQVASAGLAHDARLKVNADLVAASDLIFVMEKQHEEKLHAVFLSGIYQAIHFAFRGTCRSASQPE